MDEALEVVLLETIVGDATKKASDILKLVTIPAVTKRDVNRVLYRLKDKGILEKTQDSQWRKLPSEQHSVANQTQLLSHRQTQPLSDNQTHALSSNRSQPVSDNQAQSRSRSGNQTQTISKIRKTSQPPSVSAVGELLQKQFVAWPDRIFETLELARLIGKQYAKEVNRDLYHMEKGGVITSTGTKKWKLRSYNETSTIPSPCVYLLEETDGVIVEERARSETNQTHVKGQISMEALAFDKFPNLGIILKENIWPGPTLLCRLAENKYISTDESNKIQDASGVQEKCLTLITALMRHHGHPGITVCGLAAAIEWAGQHYLSEFLRNPGGKNQPMSKRNREILTKGSTYLLENMILDEALMHHLIQNRVICGDIQQYVNSKFTRNDTIVALLHALERCGDDAVCELRRALTNTQQSHTARF